MSLIFRQFACVSPDHPGGSNGRLGWCKSGFCRARSRRRHWVELTADGRTLAKLSMRTARTMRASVFSPPVVSGPPSHDSAIRSTSFLTQSVVRG